MPETVIIDDYECKVKTHSRSGDFQIIAEAEVNGNDLFVSETYGSEKSLQEAKEMFKVPLSRFKQKIAQVERERND